MEDYNCPRCSESMDEGHVALVAPPRGMYPKNKQACCEEQPRSSGREPAQIADMWNWFWIRTS